MISKKTLFSKTESINFVIKKDVFDREITMCQSLNKENKGHCSWGKCKDCGAPFLLNKLYKGELIEKEKEIRKFRKEILGI